MTSQNALRCFKALFSCALWICLSAAHAAAPIELTPEEASWLAQNHTVRIRVGLYPPYNFNKPEVSGMAIDYVTTAAARAGVRIELAPSTEDWTSGFNDVIGPRKRYDALLLAFRTPDREQYLAFTRAFLSAPWVIYARRDSPYFSGVEALSGKVVAL